MKLELTSEHVQSLAKACECAAKALEMALLDENYMLDFHQDGPKKDVRLSRALSGNLGLARVPPLETARAYLWPSNAVACISRKVSSSVRLRSSGESSRKASWKSSGSSDRSWSSSGSCMVLGGESATWQYCANLKEDGSPRALNFVERG
jgi:hypothetical protein